MKVSIFDVAKKSGLSVVTVSRVLNGAETVREKNRQKVLDAIKELDYRPNAAARSLARGKTGIVGLIVTTLQDSFFDAVVKELNEVLALHGYFLAVSVSTGIGSDEAHYLIQEDRVDGLILLSPMEEDNYIVELKRRNIPYVLIDNQKPENDAFSVTIDNYKGGYDAAKHLIDLGHTRIAHLSGQEMFRSTKERRSGFLQALEEKGIRPFEMVTRRIRNRFWLRDVPQMDSRRTAPFRRLRGGRQHCAWRRQCFDGRRHPRARSGCRRRL